MPRYRIEEGRACIDLHVRSVRQLFDNRDPAPFQERDLDDDAVAYLVGAVREIPRGTGLKIVVWVSDDPEPSVADAAVLNAVHTHFSFERTQIGRRLRAHVRRARMFLAIGVATLVACLSLAQFTATLPPGRGTSIAHEGLVITGWVALWRPLEALLYDWWPLVDERRLVDRVLAAPVVIRHAAPGAA